MPRHCPDQPWRRICAPALAAAAITLALAGPVPAQGLTLACQPPAGGHLPATTLCPPLHATFAGRGSSGQLWIEIVHNDAQRLAGRMAWDAGGRRGTGPVVEVTTADRPLDTRAAQRLAQGLLAVTDLP